MLVYPNVNKTLIELLKMGIKLAVVSDAPSREAWMRLYYLNLHHIFDPVLTYDDSGSKKPSPKPFMMALKELNLSAKEVLNTYSSNDLKDIIKIFGEEVDASKISRNIEHSAH